MVGQAMQMARSPDRAPEPFYALFPSDCLIKKDLEGTCFRWDKPGNRGGFARPRAPRLRFACIHGARVRASLLEWLRVEHAQWRMCFGFGKIPSCVQSRVFDGTPEARQFSEDCAGFAISGAVIGLRGFYLKRSERHRNA